MSELARLESIAATAARAIGWKYTVENQAACVKADKELADYQRANGLPVVPVRAAGG